MNSNDGGIGFIFDWDGVVVDSSKQHEESWERLAAQENLPLFDGHFKIGFGKKNEWIIPNSLKWTDELSEIERLGDEKERHYRNIIRETGLDPLPGVRAFVESLRKAELPFAVGSSTPRENIEAVMETAKMEGLFSEIVAAKDVSLGKPNPEVFLKAADAIEVSPERCIVFEDSLSGIEAGLAGGMCVVAITTTNPREILERTGASQVVDSFNEISIEGMKALLN